MHIPPHLQPFWNDFAKFAGRSVDERFYDAFHFGDSEGLANELAELVLLGVKRATASSFWSYEKQERRIPQPGDLSIVTGWAAAPVCVIETQSVEIVPFREVTAEFAFAEGEGDGSLSFWQQENRRYFTRECSEAGRQFSEDMPVACERFTVVFAPERIRAEQLKAPVTFYLDNLPVGYFLDDCTPEVDGNYKYMPFRGPGHYNLGLQLRNSRTPRCHYVANEKRVEFSVRTYVEYGVLCLSNFNVGLTP